MVWTNVENVSTSWEPTYLQRYIDGWFSSEWFVDEWFWGGDIGSIWTLVASASFNWTCDNGISTSWTLVASATSNWS